MARHLALARTEQLASSGGSISGIKGRSTRSPMPYALTHHRTFSHSYLEPCGTSRHRCHRCRAKPFDRRFCDRAWPNKRFARAVPDALQMRRLCASQKRIFRERRWLLSTPRVIYSRASKITSLPDSVHERRSRSFRNIPCATNTVMGQSSAR